MNRTHYPLGYRLDGEERYLIWYDDDPDGVLLDAQHQIPSFASHEALRAYAERGGIEIDPEPPHRIDLDPVAHWLARTVRRIDCDGFNDAWNLFGDVSSTIGGDFDADRDRTQKIYQKLFWGCNLPTVTPEGKTYIPLWTPRERRLMRKVLGAGLDLLRRHLAKQ